MSFGMKIQFQHQMIMFVLFTGGSAGGDAGAKETKKEEPKKEAAKKETKKEEPKKEEPADDDVGLGGGLFDDF